MEATLRQTWAFLFRGWHITRRYIGWVIVFNFYAVVTSATVALIGVAQGNYQLTLTLVVGALLCQRYRVHEQLESIGPTLLYRVRDEQQQMGSVDRELSIKVLRPELRAQLQWNQQLKREFEQTRQLKHPHIMRMHSVNTHQGQPFIAMEPLRSSACLMPIADV